MASSLRYLCPGGSVVSLSPHGCILQGLSTCLGILIVCWTQGSSIEKKKKPFVLYCSIPDQGFPCSTVGKESACNAGDQGLIPGLGRSLREGNGNPLQYSSLENPMDRGAWQATVHMVMGSQESDMTQHSCTYLINGVVIVSGGQQRYSPICMHVSILP